MANSEGQTNPTISKIDSALSLLADGEPGVHSRDGLPVTVYVKKMWDNYMKERQEEANKFVHPGAFISSRFPFYHLVPKSKLLKDEQLYEVILLSKIIYDYDLAYFSASSHQENEFVWIDVSRDRRHLIRGSKIIYAIDRVSVDEIRQKIKPVWEILKKNVRSNLIQALDLHIQADEKLDEVESLHAKLGESIKEYRALKVTVPREPSAAMAAEQLPTPLETSEDEEDVESDVDRDGEEDVQGDVLNQAVQVAGRKARCSVCKANGMGRRARNTTQTCDVCKLGVCGSHHNMVVKKNVTCTACATPVPPSH